MICSRSAVGEARAAAIESEHGGKVEVDGICFPPDTRPPAPRSLYVERLKSDGIPAPGGQFPAPSLEQAGNAASVDKGQEMTTPANERGSSASN